MRKEVETLIRELGGPNDPALITRHPKAFKRGTVLIKAPINDCLQRAVERVEGKILAAAEAEKRDNQQMLLKQQQQDEAAAAQSSKQKQQLHGQAALGQQQQQQQSTSSLHPDLLNALVSPHQRNNNDPSSPTSKTNTKNNLTRAQSAEAAHSARRSSNNIFGSRGTPSPCRGAVMSFKSNARLFLGKDFPCGAVESPGPIYEQKGFGIDTANGRSFTKAKRDLPDQSSSNAGPSYTGIPAIGKQFLSVRENPTNVVFSKSGRFGEVKENERLKNRGKKIASPGPGAYLSDLDHLPHHRGKAFSPAPSLGVRHSSNTFISREHFAEYQGRCSPGPLYDVSGLQRGTFPPSKTPTFGKGERISLAKQDKVPGPGQYQPENKETIVQGPSIGFAKSRRMANNMTDSPGPIYTPSYEFSEKGHHVVRIGNGPDEDYEKPRFNNKLHLGKKLGVDAVGRDSPGPMYNPERKWDGPQYSIQFREPRVRPSLFPRPERARWISEQSAKENLGAWSPGPKYDTRGDITKYGGITYSFGSSTTNRGGEQQQQQQQQGTNNASNVSGNKSVVGNSIASASAGGGGNDESGTTNQKLSSGNVVPFYNTDISHLSTTKPIHSVIISPITKRKTPGGAADTGNNNNNATNQRNISPHRSGGGAGGDNNGSGVDETSAMYNPAFENFKYRSAPAFTFGKGDRSSSIWQASQDKSQQKGGSTVTGSGTLNINYSQVQYAAHGPRLGGLSMSGL